MDDTKLVKYVKRKAARVTDQAIKNKKEVDMYRYQGFRGDGHDLFVIVLGIA